MPPHGQMMPSQPFMGPRYPGGPRPVVRMPPQMPGDFNGPPGQSMMGNSGPGPGMGGPRGGGMGSMGPGKDTQ